MNTSRQCPACGQWWGVVFVDLDVSGDYAMIPSDTCYGCKPEVSADGLIITGVDMVELTDAGTYDSVKEER